jgi:murein DD-endopeptidase MepM/ murein hydrolase activator NlpD
LEVLKLKEKTKLNELEARIKEKEDLIQTLQNNEQLYEEQLDDLLKSSNEIESLIKQEQARIEKERLALEASKSSQSQVDNTNVYSSYAGGMLLWPVPGRSSISSGYGTRISPISGKSEFHTGIDIPAPTGSNIVAAESGVIISAGNQNGYGLTVVISHSNSLSTLYAHNSRLVVQTGQRVNRGDIIAKAGSTGYSTGPHSHFEVRVSGAHTNPINYLK